MRINNIDEGFNRKYNHNKLSEDSKVAFDVAGQELHLGDEVYIVPKDKRQLFPGIVKEIRSTQMLIEYVNNWRYRTLDGERDYVPETYLARSNQVIKKP